ncbi:MAG: hypothetical protein ACJAQT_002035 [Akkermansiaceae bacterium]|jgi:hypothetical protein
MDLSRFLVVDSAARGRGGGSYDEMLFLARNFMVWELLLGQ